MIAKGSLTESFEGWFDKGTYSMEKISWWPNNFHIVIDFFLNDEDKQYCINKKVIISSNGDKRIFFRNIMLPYKY